MDWFHSVHDIERKASNCVNVVRDASDKNSSNILARSLMARSMVMYLEKLSTERRTAIGD